MQRLLVLSLALLLHQVPLLPPKVPRLPFSLWLPFPQRALCPRALLLQGPMLCSRLKFSLHPQLRFVLLQLPRLRWRHHFACRQETVRGGGELPCSDSAPSHGFPRLRRHVPRPTGPDVESSSYSIPRRHAWRDAAHKLIECSSL